MSQHRCALAVALTLACAGCGGGAQTPTNPGAGVVGTPVPNEGWAHVPLGTPVTYRSNPPASGPHYPVWARYQEYTAPVERPYWVHNIEHGAIVLLYRPDAPPATVVALVDAFRALPVDPACGHARALLTPDPLLPGLVAAVAADWVLTADGVDAVAIREFALVHRNRAPEDVCASGSR